MTIKPSKIETLLNAAGEKLFEAVHNPKEKIAKIGSLMLAHHVMLRYTQFGAFAGLTAGVITQSVQRFGFLNLFLKYNAQHLSLSTLDFKSLGVFIATGAVAGAIIGSVKYFKALKEQGSQRDKQSKMESASKMNEEPSGASTVKDEPPSPPRRPPMEHILKRRLERIKQMEEQEALEKQGLEKPQETRPLRPSV